MNSREQNRRRQQIVASFTSKEEKQRALIAIGFGAYEAMCIIEEHDAQVQAEIAQREAQEEQLHIESNAQGFPSWQNQEFNMAEFRTANTFGVEIECLVPRQRLIDEASQFGRTILSQGYNHEDRRDYFKIVRDSSVMGEDPNEVVSPILKGVEGFSHLEDVCCALNRAGAKVNKTCGLHVHISSEHLTEADQMNVYRLYAKAEKVIDTFMPKSRRGSENCYCRSIARYVNKSKSEVLQMGRYHKVNLTALLTHNTIEFRQHSGSVEYEKISMWVKFCLLLVEYVKHYNIDIDRVQINSIDDMFWLTSDVKEFYKARKAHFDSQNR